MIGVGWPLDDFPPAGGVSDTDLVVGLASLGVLVVLGVLYVWAERRARRRVQPATRIERPAELRRAA